VATVFNEQSNIVRLLDSLAEQTLLPDEVVICDGGSRDATLERLHKWALENDKRLPNLRVVVEEGANISRGRNLAIAASTGAVIAVTDAGVKLSPRWLEALVRPWNLEGERTIGSAGFFVADARGVFETAMAATVLPLVEEVNPDKFLPSSRSVAFSREAWRAVGGYPEWLDYGEDLVFDLRVNELEVDRPTAFAWSPQAVVDFRPREDLRSFWTQYYRYARGDGKADLWRKRHLVRYITYLVLVPALVGHALWGNAWRWLGWVGLAAGLVVYCRRPLHRLSRVGQSRTTLEQVQAAGLIPVIRVVGDVAKMVGYPVGLWWRWQNRKRPEIWWRDPDSTPSK
jgi:glycosyltransferase involved in cell wall biosynthesis